MLAKPEATRFDCPNCGARYKIVRVEADSQSDDRPISCRKCGVPLQGREGSAVLKYFLIGQPKAKSARARSIIPSSGRQ